MSAPGKPLPDDGLGILTTLTVAVLFSGAAFTLVGGRSGRCAGSRRSVKLEFERQKIEMQQLAEDAECQSRSKESAETGVDYCHE